MLAKDAATGQAAGAAVGAASTLICALWRDDATSYFGHSVWTMAERTADGSLSIERTRAEETRIDT